MDTIMNTELSTSYSVEFLNSLELLGVPSHKLQLKLNVPVMLMRNCVTMTGLIYRDVILEQHVLLLRDAMGAEFLFMDDNARPLRANIVDKCL
ncbi:hypothetical protein TNCV_845631 [Trichonephila clavipes]|nr:hypothetical protein TNCV_845631 [Trichonephila clavipes]